jgi:DNA mismatch repair protein MLH1
MQVENLFYNVPARLSALRSSSEEYARILDVVTRYAIHNAGVSFLCKKVRRQSRKPIPGAINCVFYKVGTSAPDLSTPSSETKQAVRLLYGQGVAKDLLSVDISPPSTKKRKRDADDSGTGEPNEDGSWSAKAHFTNANYHSKKTVFLLFINSNHLLRRLCVLSSETFADRLVESSRIKKAIEACYTGVLPKGTSPFIYLR